MPCRSATDRDVKCWLEFMTCYGRARFRFRLSSAEIDEGSAAHDLDDRGSRRRSYLPQWRLICTRGCKLWLSARSYRPTPSIGLDRSTQTVHFARVELDCGPFCQDFSRWAKLGWESWRPNQIQLTPCKAMRAALAWGLIHSAARRNVARFEWNTGSQLNARARSGRGRRSCKIASACAPLTLPDGQAHNLKAAGPNPAPGLPRRWVDPNAQK